MPSVMLVPKLNAKKLNSIQLYDEEKFLRSKIEKC